MNINIFFASVFLSLLMIFFLFKPLDIKQQNFVDVPLFELTQFTLLELNNQGLTTLMRGESATRYSNRYVVKEINYTDNAKVYIANMKANSGTYKDNIITLNGDITYVREDGLTFQTQEAIYNKKTNVATVDGMYKLFQGSNIVSGTLLKYNNLLNKAESKYVKAKYELGDKF